MVIGRLRILFRRWRSAITGKFVSRTYAAKHPDTTIGETVERDQ